MMLMGCAGEAKVDKHNGTVSNGEAEAAITEYNLSDGTRCAVLIGYSKGAIDCDWNSSRDYQ